MSQTEKWDLYVQLASAIADPAIQSRVGFGTFRKFPRLFEKSLGLVAGSGLLAPSGTGAPWPWAMDPEFFHFAMRHGQYNHSHFLRHLKSPEVYAPACIWALFWALAKAEHRFSNKYLPFWSHEERLTGHFISQICERIEEFNVHWSSLIGTAGERSWLDVWYADTSAGNREKETGADLGLILHGQYASDDEFYKVARFQVKKVPSNNSARIDLSQTKALLRQDYVGHYLFFHAQDSQEWRRPPSVAPASEFQYRLEQAEKKLIEQKKEPKNLGDESIENVDGSSFDFATFITFGIADPAADFGAFARSKASAVRVLMSGGPPSRLAVISLGEQIQPSEWLHEMEEYVRFPRGENS